MPEETLDCKGLKCPQPVLRVAIKSKSLAPGTTLNVIADCSSFPDDIQKWCQETGKVLINCLDQGGGTFTATIQF